MRIDHVAIGTRDLEQAVAWYSDVVGLGEVARDGGRWFLGCGGRPSFDLVLDESGPGMRHVAYAVYDETEYEAAVRRLGDNGLTPVEIEGDEPGINASVAAALPGGHVVELVLRDGADRYVQASQWSATAAGSPRELDHVNIATVDVDASVQAAQTALALMLSDLHQTDEGRTVGAWLRAGDRHHDFAAIANRAEGLHHLAYQLSDGPAVAAFADRLVRMGSRAEYGVGRHGPGSNVFLYTRDPSGNRVELCADMALVPRGAPHRVWRGRDDSIINSWAPYGPPRSFWEIT